MKVANGGMFGQCWTHAAQGSEGAEHTYGFRESDKYERKKVAYGDVFGIWVYLGPDIVGVGFSVRADDSESNDKGWTATVCWGTGINQGSATWFTNKGELPQKGKWVQLAADVRELGLSDDWFLTGIEFREAYAESKKSQVWWDRVVLWKNVYTLPDFVEPDMTQFPIEFNKDGSLKGTRVTTDVQASWKPAEKNRRPEFWFDRMIILKDSRDQELQYYLRAYDNPETLGTDTYDNKVADGDGFWECEPFEDDSGGTDGWLDGSETWSNYGPDRVKGTNDKDVEDVNMETNSVWDYEGRGLSEEVRPQRAPNGQIYIKINKITGIAKICSHPGE
jgi:hypothetical protein